MLNLLKLKAQFAKGQAELKLISEVSQGAVRTRIHFRAGAADVSEDRADRLPLRPRRGLLHQKARRAWRISHFKGRTRAHTCSHVLSWLSELLCVGAEGHRRAQKGAVVAVAAVARSFRVPCCDSLKRRHGMAAMAAWA